MCLGVRMCEWGVSSHGQLSEFRYTGAVCIYLPKPGPLGEKEKCLREYTYPFNSKPPGDTIENKSAESSGPPRVYGLKKGYRQLKGEINKLCSMLDSAKKQ